MRINRETERMDARARRAAKRTGWIARKSRSRAGTIDNIGGFTVVDPFHNNVLYGEKFDLTAEDVLEVCDSDDSA